MDIRRYPTILAVITTSWLAFLGLFTLAKPTFAQTTNVSAKYNLTLQLAEDLSGTFDYMIDIQNNDPQLVQEYNLNLPFSAVDQVSGSRDGQGVAVNSNQADKNISFTIKLGDRPIRTGQSTQLKLHFHVPDLLTRNYELTQLYLPKLETGYSVSAFQLQLTYPSNFPPLSYVSDSKPKIDGHKLTLNSFSGFLVLWGDEAIYDIKENVPLKLTGDQNQQAFFNFIPRLPDQDVVYKTITGVSSAGTDRNLNIWGIAKGDKKNVYYEARIHRLGKNYAKFDDQIQIKYPTLDRPAGLQALQSIPQDTVQKLRSIYDFLVTNYKASNETNITRDQATDLAAKAAQNGAELNNLEFASIGASLIQNENIPVHVVYGYVITPSELNAFNTRRPHVWLEALVNGNVVVLDPYLQALTGYSFWDTININRLELGIWDPSDETDSVLGILSSGLRPAPASAALGEITQELKYNLYGDFPGEVLAGENYSGKLNVDNHSGYFLIFKNVTLNGQDVTDKLRLSEDLVPAAFPLSTTSIEIKYLFEPNLLEDRTAHNKIMLTPELELFPPQTISYDIKFSPNQKIIIFITTVGVLGLTFLVVAIAYVVSKSVIRKRI
jgi:hypothetical protein